MVVECNDGEHGEKVKYWLSFFLHLNVSTILFDEVLLRYEIETDCCKYFNYVDSPEDKGLWGKKYIFNSLLGYNRQV